MKSSNTVGAIAKALAKAQATMQNPGFDASNPHFRSKFASLAAVRNTVVPAFAAVGISVTQELTNEPGGIGCTTILMHESGEWLAYGPFVVAPMKDDAQGRGSASTYGRRYSLQSVAGVVGDEDDDAEAAQGRTTAKISPIDNGEAGTPQQKKYAADFAAAFRCWLDADLEEDQKAREIAQLSNEIKEDETVAMLTWGQLNARERKAIKEYTGKARKAAA